MKTYKTSKAITIFLTAIMLPFGTFVGYQFGKGNVAIALIALTAQTLITALQAHIWWLTLEKQKET